MQDISSDIFLYKNKIISKSFLKKEMAEIFLSDALDLIFPGMSRKFFKNKETLDNFLGMHSLDLEKILISLSFHEREIIEKVIVKYKSGLLGFCEQIEKDADALYKGDPAAKSLEEVLICYPGLYAIGAYRIAHFFFNEKIPIFPRLISEIAHAKTGIDIHPGATIGESFFIDHGTGVVIGETALIGNSVKIYQGVTLGALSVEKGLAQTKRHPTIKDHCVIYSHATILGGETIIGENSIIGGNVWMTKSVPANSLVYHKSQVKLDSINNKDKYQEELTYEI